MRRRGSIDLLEFAIVGCGEHLGDLVILIFRFFVISIIIEEVRNSNHVLAVFDNLVGLDRLFSQEEASLRVYHVFITIDGLKLFIALVILDSGLLDLLFFLLLQVRFFLLAAQNALFAQEVFFFVSQNEVFRVVWYYFIEVLAELHGGEATLRFLNLFFEQS